MSAPRCGVPAHAELAFARSTDGTTILTIATHEARGRAIDILTYCACGDINLKTAKVLNLSIPTSLPLRADQLIEEA